MVTDTIGDFIIRIKNANFALKEAVSMHSSKNKVAIAEALARVGYIKSFSKNNANNTLEIVLSYKSDKSPKISGIQRISKPSRRVYQKSSEIRPFRNGFGATIFSTPAGILSNKEAVKQKVGGEVLFKIW